MVSASRQRTGLAKDFKGPLATPPGPLRGKLCLGTILQNTDNSIVTQKIQLPENDRRELSEAPGWRGSIRLVKLV